MESKKMTPFRPADQFSRIRVQLVQRAVHPRACGVDDRRRFDSPNRLAVDGIRPTDLDVPFGQTRFVVCVHFERDALFC